MKKLTLLEPRKSGALQGPGYYTLEHVASGMRYHGSSVNVKRRLTEHQADLRAGIHGNLSLQSLVNSDTDLRVDVTLTDSIEEAREAEDRLIRGESPHLLLNVAENVYNSLKGLQHVPLAKARHSAGLRGNTNALGSRHSEEWKKDKSAQMLGNTHLSGHIHSEESRAKMSASHKGHVNSDDHKRRSAFGRTREHVRVGNRLYFNLAAAAEDLDITDGGVRKRCYSDRWPDYELQPATPKTKESFQGKRYRAVSKE